LQRVVLVVVISSIAGTCAIAVRHDNPPSRTTVAFEVVQPGSAVGPGTYEVGSTEHGVEASLEMTDASCNIIGGGQSTTGTVTITTSTADRIEGSFDLTFDSGDHLTGTFAAPVCGALLFASMTGACGT
jgi:hypothetical protein